MRSIAEELSRWASSNTKQFPVLPILLPLLWCFFLFYILYSLNEQVFVPGIVELAAVFQIGATITSLFFLGLLNSFGDILVSLLSAEDCPEMVLGSMLGLGLFTLSLLIGCIFLTEFSRRKKESQQTPESRSLLKRISVNKRLFLQGLISSFFCCTFLLLLLLLEEITSWLCILALVLYFIYLLLIFILNSGEKELPIEKVTEEPPLTLKTNKTRILFQAPFFFLSLFLFPVYSLLETKSASPTTMKMLRIRTFSSVIFFGLPVFFLLNPLQFSGVTKYVFLCLSCLYPFCSVLFVWLLTSWKRPPSLPSLHLLFSLLFSCVWIYCIVVELVASFSLLNSSQILPSSALGLSLLCLGNNLPDLFCNILLVRRTSGWLNISLFGIFSGFFQTVFLQIGIGMLPQCLKHGTLQFQSTRLLWCAFGSLVANFFLLAVFVLTSKFSFQPFHGWILVSYYILALFVFLFLSFMF